MSNSIYRIDLLPNDEMGIACSGMAMSSSWDHLTEAADPRGRQPWRPNHHRKYPVPLNGACDSGNDFGCSDKYHTNHHNTDNYEYIVIVIQK